MTLIERFESHSMPEPNSGCWIWIGSSTRAGYGRFNFDGRNQLAHRVSWLIYKGAPPPSDLCVCHQCDTPSCVNPDHLWLGSYTDNRRDAIRKGRNATQVGAANSRAVLTENQVRAILSDTRTCLELGREYGVSKSTINAIKTGHLWPHLFSEWISMDATRRAEMKL